MLTIKHKNHYGNTDRYAFALRWEVMKAYHTDVAVATAQIWITKLADSQKEPGTDAHWDTIGTLRWQANRRVEGDLYNGRAGHIQPLKADGWSRDGEFCRFYAMSVDYIDHGLDWREQFSNMRLIEAMVTKVQNVVTEYNLFYRWGNCQLAAFMAAARKLGIWELDYHDGKQEVTSYPRKYSYIV